MTFRERIADWISGGALTEARKIGRLHYENAVHLDKMVYRFSLALNNIAAMETPSANSTVRRMARHARETMEGE